MKKNVGLDQMLLNTVYDLVLHCFPKYHFKGKHSSRSFKAFESGFKTDKVQISSKPVS